MLTNRRVSLMSLLITIALQKVIAPKKVAILDMELLTKEHNNEASQYPSNTVIGNDRGSV